VKRRLQFVRVCDCGCGQPTTVATQTNNREGRIKGQPTRFIVGHTNIPRPRRSLEERFHAKFEKGAPDECWLWQGAIKDTGYAALSRGGQGEGIVYAHRLADELDGREIPEGMVVDHLCRNRACVNPAHLEVVTHQVNIRRGEAPSIVIARTGICTRGHVIADDYEERGNGKRACRKCIRITNRDASRRYREKKRAERAAA
jgi:hypothetical protein